MRAAWFFLAVAVSPCALDARIWVVAQSGGDFPDLPPAVAAAAPGDTILVDYGSFTGPTITRGIEIVAIPGPYAPMMSTPFVIQALPAGERVLIRGFGGSVFATPVFLEARQCAGLIQVEDCLVLGVSGGYCPGSPAMLFDRCTQVILNGCGVRGPYGCDLLSGQPAVRALSSNLFVHGGWIRGATARSCAGERGGLGLEAISSSVVLSDTLVEGGIGSGASCLVPSCMGGPGGTGCVATGSRFWQYRSEVLAGFFGEFQCWPTTPPSRNGVDWGVRPLGHVVDPEPLPSLEFESPPLLGGAASLLVGSHAQRSQFVFAAFDLSARQFPPLVGTLWLDLGSIFLVGVIPPGPSPQLLSIPIESEPLAIGVDIHFQAIDEIGRFGAVTSDVLR